MSNQFLNYEGLQTYHNKVKDALNDKANKSEGVFFVDGTSTTAGIWTGQNSSITEYYDGLTILYKVNISSAETTTLNINDLGAKTIYESPYAKLSSNYPVGSCVMLVYFKDVNNGCWINVKGEKVDAEDLNITALTEIDILSAIWEAEHPNEEE